MRRGAALILAVLALIWAQQVAGPDISPGAGTALALGFTLLGASIVGDVLRRVHLPRLTGYLLFGLAAGPYLGNLITQPMAAQLQVISGMATAFIALIAGLTLNLDRLGRRLSHIGRLTATILGVAMVGAGSGCVDGVAVAADRAACVRHRQARNGASADRHPDQFFSDDDGGGDDGNRHAQPPQRNCPGRCRAG